MQDQFEKNILDLIDNGKYKEVNQNIENILANEIKDLKKELFLLNQHAKIELIFSNFEKAQSISNELNDKSSRYEIPAYKLAAFQKKLEISYHLGKFTEILLEQQRNQEVIVEIIQKIEEQQDQNEIRILGEYYYSLGKNCQNSEKFEKAIECYEKSLELFNKINDDLNYALTLEQFGDIYDLHGNHQLSFEKLNKSLEFCEKFDDNLVTAWINSHLAWTYHNTGNIEKMDKYSTIALDIAKQIGNIHCLDWCYEIKSHLFYEKDEIEKAIYYCNKSLEFRIKRGNIIEIAHAHSWSSFLNISNHDQGEAEKRILEMIDYSTKITIPRWKAYFSTNAARFFESIGMDKKALNYLEKSREILKSSDDIEAFADTLHYIIKLSINLNYLEYCHLIIDDLNELSKKNTDNQKIGILFQLDKALILENSSRLKDKINAQVILRDLISKYEIKDRLYIEILMNYCNMLFVELYYSYEENILKELEEMSEIIYNEAKSKSLWPILTQALLLKAKIALNKMDINTSFSYLIEAERLADQKGLILLAKEISMQHDNLLDLVEKIKSDPNNKDLIKNLLEINSNSLLYSLPQEKVNKFEAKSKNIPKYLIIWSKKGLNLFSYSFSKEKNALKPNFLANFLSAFDQFGKQALTSEGSIDRIRHGEYTIIIKKIHPFNVGYIFIGDSYTSTRKLKKFIDFIAENQKIYKSLLKSHEIGLVSGDKIQNKINQRVEDIFD